VREPWNPGPHDSTMDELRADYAQIKDVYASAIREVDARLTTMDSEFSIRHRHNPIHHTESRVKSLNSIIKKLRSLGIPVSIINAKKALNDIAGVRVVCRYVDDIYRIANLLLMQDDVVLILEKDYIKNPKTNGYRSLHIVVDIPVYRLEGKLFVPVEIQIRTVAMDFWATLEHGIRYKASEEVPRHIGEELKDCADVIFNTDLRMQDVFKTLQQVHDLDDDFTDLPL